MAANYKKYRVRVMLECGHPETVKVEYPNRVPPEFVPCGKCNADVAIYAIECREWRAKCTQCRYTRWTGQSENSAQEIARAHWASKNHSMSVRYYINPETFEIVKKFADYAGRGFRFRMDSVPRIRFPRKINDRNEPDTPPF